MMRTNRISWKGFVLTAEVLATAALGACSGAPGDLAEGDGAPATEQQPVDENLASPALAAAIADSKVAMLGGSVSIQKNASCGRAGPTGSSTRHNDAPSQGAANQRSGSSTGCVALGVLQPTDDALYYCFTFANDGFTWTYNQNLRTRVRGWTRDDLLDGFGSFTWCGF